MAKRNLDFAKINAAALANLPVLLRRWLPNGTVRGREYCAINPTRADRRSGSFKIALHGSRAGAWADFATGDRGGDLIALYAYLNKLSQTEAARQLAAILGVDHA
jgi:hypothetical protein